MFPVRTSSSDERGSLRRAVLFSTVTHIAVIVWAMIPLATGPRGAERVAVIESGMSELESLPLPSEAVLTASLEQLPETSSSRPPSETDRLLSLIDGSVKSGSSRLIPFPASLVGETSSGKAGQQEQAADQASRKISKPTGNAVTKGSFTVWTSPESPEIRQNYWVFIVVALPTKIRISGRPDDYPVSDVTGRVKGSDSYTQSLLFDRRFPGVVEFLNSSGSFVKATKNTRIPISDKGIRLRVLVAGAEQPKTKDEVVLSSQILRETQELTLTFTSGATSRGNRGRPGITKKRLRLKRRTRDAGQ